MMLVSAILAPYQGPNNQCVGNTRQQGMNGILRSSLTRVESHVRSDTKSDNNIPIAARPLLRLLILSTHYVDSRRLRLSQLFIIIVITPQFIIDLLLIILFIIVDWVTAAARVVVVTSLQQLPHPIPQMLATLKYR